jgi:hypothetical protein
LYKKRLKEAVESQAEERERIVEKIEMTLGNELCSSCKFSGAECSTWITTKKCSWWQSLKADILKGVE